MKKFFICLLCFVFIALSILTVVYYKNTLDKKPSKGSLKPKKVIAEVQDKITPTQKQIIVPAISQYPDLPTGCESVAATMVLQYYGVDITPGEFVISWLDYSEDFFTANDKLYGPNPNEVFAGNPFTNNSYGCFADPIVNAINHNSTTCSAKKITDYSLEELCTKYIDNNKPLLIWATMDMKESYAGRSWYLKDGSLFTWTAREHCLVLTGYNDDYYFLNDPMSGSTVAYHKSIVQKRFSELGNQAVYIYPH